MCIWINKKNAETQKQIEMVRRAAPKKVKLSDSRTCLTRHKRASKVALPENVRRRRSTYRHSAAPRNNRKKENKRKKQNKKYKEKRVDNYTLREQYETKNVNHRILEIFFYTNLSTLNRFSDLRNFCSMQQMQKFKA